MCSCVLVVSKQFHSKNVCIPIHFNEYNKRFIVDHVNVCILPLCVSICARISNTRYFVYTIFVVVRFMVIPVSFSLLYSTRTGVSVSSLRFFILLYGCASKLFFVSRSFFIYFFFNTRECRILVIFFLLFARLI